MAGIILPFNGMTPKVHPDAFIAETAVLIGDVEVGAGSSIWYGCVLRGDINRIRVGEGTNIQDGSIVHVNHDPAGDYRETGGGMPTFIGDHITIGHMALIHACTLESHCFIGMRSVVMDEAVVKPYGMVAAGALVTPRKVVGEGELWAGSPARRLRSLSDEDRKNLPYIAKHYGKLSAAYKAD